MDTEGLIKAMAADAGRRGPGLGARWGLAAGSAVLLAGAVFFLLLTPRSDLGAAAEGARFWVKLGTMLALALAALPALAQAARPGPLVLPATLWAAPLALAAAVGVEAWVLPPGTAAEAALGRHPLACLGLIPLIGLAPLGVCLAFLRSGAPTEAARAGALAGVAAGALAASFYALHCTDDSPLFVATWYVLAVLVLAALGAVAAPRVARW